MTLFAQRWCLTKILNNTPKVCSSKYFSYNNTGLKEQFNDYRYSKDEKHSSRKLVAFGATLAGIIAYDYYNKRRYAFLATPQVSKEAAGTYRKDLPSFTLEEVNKHSTKEDGIWVTYKQGVYDITNFINEHPGGDQIMMAAGSSVEPFWLLYGIHNTPQIFGILEEMRIGNISEEETKHVLQDLDDPYAAEPLRHKVLKPASQKPFNAEPPAALLVENFLTPNEIFYVRNHLPVPQVDAETYELEIEVEGTRRRKVLKLKDIKRLPRYTINATVMCAGNRRSEMNKVKEVKGLSWGQASIGNAQWTGARLTDVLKLVGIDDETEGYNHVQFEGLDTNTSNVPYGASIPFVKAVDRRGDVLLAYEMNGEPIPRDHGFPIRVIVPGVVGARNVKWLGKIIISKNESESHWQQFDYKGFSPSTGYDNIDWSKSPAIQELPVISAICNPSSGDTVKVEDGHITVKGYAWSGGGKKIIRVDVTPDGGATWYNATFDQQDNTEQPQHWSWTLWSVRIPVTKKSKEVEIWAKAVDSSYNTQPESFENIWNVRGVLSNAYHRVKINLKW